MPPVRSLLGAGALAVLLAAGCGGTVDEPGEAAPAEEPAAEEPAADGDGDIATRGLDDVAADDPAATVGEAVLTRAELDASIPDPSAATPELYADLISRWVVFTAIEIELDERGAVSADVDVQTAQAAISAVDPDFDFDDPSAERIVDQQRIVALAERWARESLGDADTGEPPGYLCSNHILLATSEDAEAVLDRLAAGEDFAELAVELSTGPSGPDGGDLGCVVEGSFVPEFEAAAYAASAGDVIGPVETQFGFHVIQIESVGPATAEFHPEVPEEELAAAAASGVEAAVQTLLGELQQAAFARSVASVSVDPAYGTFDPAGFVVRPPG